MKKTMLFLVCSVLLLSGCTKVFTKKDVKFFDESASISTHASFYLVMPKDGHEISYWKSERVENAGSGKEAGDVFFKKFHKRFGSLVQSDAYMPLEQGLAAAKARGDKYTVTLDINEWNDEFYMTCVPSNTGAAVKTDSIDISVQVYETATGKLLNKQRLQNAGCPAVFLSFIPIGTMGPKGRFSSSLDVWLKNIQ